MKIHKRSSLFMAVLILLSLVLPGCAVPEPAETTAPPETHVPQADTTVALETTEPEDTVPEEIVLRVLTDDAPGPGYMMTLEKAIAKVINDFEDSHENVTIELEYLPADEAERSAALEEMRHEIDRGEGPDIFLLSSGEITSSVSRSMDVTLEPLFSQMPVSLVRGIFADLSEYYDADTSLNKDALISGVMDTGLVKDARYVIPLRYNFPVAYVDMAKFADTGLNTDIFENGSVEMMTALAENEVPVSVEDGANVLAGLVGDSSTAESELVYNLTQYQALLPYLKTNGHETVLSRYVSMNGDPETDFYWSNDGYCMQFSTLETAVDQAVIAQAAGIDLGMFPVANADGIVVADITFFGAVNADCAHVDLAYEFIAGFLTEDLQWEKNLTPNGVPLGSLMMADGYPVLRTGSVAAIFENMNYNQENTEVQTVVNGLDISDEDVPVLSENLPARFPNWENRQMQTAVESITVDATADKLAALAASLVKK